MCCLADLLRLMPDLSEIAWTEYYNDRPVNDMTCTCTKDFLLKSVLYRTRIEKPLCYFTRIDIYPCVNSSHIFIRYDTYGDD